ncbi:single-stranded DNA-binding protein [Aceticella autotrophica]|uniref:Single-stranded DNA-binding protein n=1 Tax=Aceticella autotrophica TaxID=2755338 RepID=A0A975AVR7_9THEO|nr:single-stranded DNA-binding protein [Aceticella autotrophica]MDI6604817.1 single-stranded DNA-binding protein [Thermoanaerobacteraceae bacterium]QSZ27350.1 single-stranded DNA-binding protein [Aceticella autotrophica]
MLNKVILIGRLTKDPVLKYSSNNMIPVSTFTIAVNRNYTTQSGERPADFIPIVTWRKLAEVCANNLKKGRLVAVVGSIQTRTWDDTNGTRHWVTEVVADEVKFLDSNRNGGVVSPNIETQKASHDINEDIVNDDFEGFTPVGSEDDLPF